jgi:hypothetical protein
VATTDEARVNQSVPDWMPVSGHAGSGDPG